MRWLVESFISRKREGRAAVRAVGPEVPVARAPVLDDVEAARLEVVLEEVPEADAGLRSRPAMTPRSK
jgi:hypothetical protein